MAVERILTCVTVHGDTDHATKHAWHEANEDACEANARRNPDQSPHVRRDLVCHVEATFKGENGARLELTFNDWADVAGLKEGVKATIRIGD